MPAEEDEFAARQAAGRWLRDQRHRHGFTTVGELARALGVDPSRVSNYENGRSKVPDDRADKIAELFGMSWRSVRRGLRLWLPPGEQDIDDDEEDVDRLERAWRRYRDDPGDRGTVLRGLLETWDERDEGDGGDEQQEAG